MRAGKFPLTLMGGQAEGLLCADPGARTPNGVSRNYQLPQILSYISHNYGVYPIFYSHHHSTPTLHNWAGY